MTEMRFEIGQQAKLGRAVGKTYETWSAPREGVSLARATELRGKPIREAVTALSSGFRGEWLAQAFQEAFAPRWSHICPALTIETLSYRAAWNLVGIWLIARSHRGSTEISGIREAEVWFRGTVPVGAPLLCDLVAHDNLRRAQHLLDSVSLDAELMDLLPYILEEHGPGSRASVMKDLATAGAREAKRQNGVFYTPSDVAQYMVDHTRQIYSADFQKANMLDPACGTGVFFLAMVRSARDRRASNETNWQLDYITSRLYGLDISGQALDSAALILLRECLPDVLTREIAPWSAWHLIRLNLVECDALSVGPVHDTTSASGTDDGSLRQSIRESLLCKASPFVPVQTSIRSPPSDVSPSDAGLFGKALPRLCDVFPDVRSGFDLLIGNPPYAPLGDRSCDVFLRDRFACLRSTSAGPRVNLFPLFVEMMWDLTRVGQNASALVVPLSIAFHTGSQFHSCRTAMSKSGGRWQFAFFDREPHALFGEEVKTRSAILFRSEDEGMARRAQPAEIETGPLRKWTSRMRSSLFENIEFTRVGPLNIATGIPKLRGTMQANAFMVLRQHPGGLGSLCRRIDTCDPAEALVEAREPMLFVGGTAYNFLNLYRSASLSAEERHRELSRSPVHRLEFRSESDASETYAILNSRLVFWLWHALGDGFHVPRRFLEDIPFGKGILTTEALIQLQMLGDRLWSKVQSHRFTSLNGGRLTIGFRPLSCNEELDAIDLVVIRDIGLGEGLATELRGFVRENTVVDSTDSRRIHMEGYFTEGVTE